jgi:hypothetical protein
MRRIALCLYALVLLLPAVGCKKEEPAPAPAGGGAAAPADDAAGDKAAE